MDVNINNQFTLESFLVIDAADDQEKCQQR